MVDRFERAFAEAVGLPHATAVSSGTAALHLALVMLGLKPGDAVIAPTLTFIGGVSPILQTGSQVIFVDVDPVSWNLDPAHLDAAFEVAATRGLTVRAIVPADLYGQCCDIDAIRAVADERAVPVILDAAEAVGATRHGRPSGHGAMAAAYSFNGNKIVTSGGGGMLASENGALIARARHLATAARLPAIHYEHAEAGFNYRLGSLAAAVGLAQIGSLDAKVERRRAIFARYKAHLGHVPGLSFAPEAPGCRHTRWLSVIRLDPALACMPEALRLALEAANIESRPIWKPMHLQPAFVDATVVGGEVAETLFATGLCLPSGSALTDEDIDRVCDVVLSALGDRVDPLGASL